MKGLVLAGGLATRMHPMTKVVNKHLLDVFDEPIVYYPLKSLQRAGITDVMIVTNQVEQFQQLLDDGSELGLRISYGVQAEPKGIADGIAKAERFADGDRLMVMLGDNIFQDELKPFVDDFLVQDKGAKVLLKEVAMEDAQRFGVAVVKEGKIVEVEEKPKNPKSNLAQTGCYMYDNRVFDFIKDLTPSARGELEVTDLNNIYVREGTMTYDLLRGWWSDAGTPASKLKASILVALQKGVVFHQ